MQFSIDLEQIADKVAKRMEKSVWMTIPQREEIRKMIVQEFAPIVVQQSNFHFSAMDSRANEDQAMKILGLLKERRSAGATNVELVKIAMNHTARISELRQPPNNYKINCVRESGRIYRYFLYSTDW